MRRPLSKSTSNALPRRDLSGRLACGNRARATVLASVPKLQVIGGGAPARPPDFWSGSPTLGSNRGPADWQSDALLDLLWTLRQSPRRHVPYPLSHKRREMWYPAILWTSRCHSARWSRRWKYVSRDPVRASAKPHTHRCRYPLASQPVNHHRLSRKPQMHVLTAANQQFPVASILRIFPTELPDAETDVPEKPGQRLRVVDGLVSAARCSWAEPFDTFGDFAA